MNKEELIRQSAFFQGLSEKNTKSLAEICVLKELPKKKILFLQGETGEAIYLLASGSVGLYKNKPDGKEIAIRMIKPGELFAEVILFGQDTYPVTAISLTAGYVYGIHKDKFNTLLETENFRNDFIHLLLKKQRYLTNQILYLTTHDVEERLFLFLKEHYGEKENIMLEFSKKDIASAIGTTPETLSRLLLRLKQCRDLIWQENKISIKEGFWKKWQLS